MKKITIRQKKVAICGFLLFFIFLGISLNCHAESDISLPEEQVIVNEKGIVITAKDFKNYSSTHSYSLLLEIENRNDVPVTVYADKTSINGIMVDGSIYAEVDANSSRNAAVDFMSFELETLGISKIGEIETAFHIKGEGIDFLTDIVCLKTTLYGTFEQSYDDSGEVLMDEKGIRIVKKEFKINNYSAGVDFYTENNSGRAVKIIASENIVNGNKSESILTFRAIENGKVAADYLSFFNDELSEIGINRIDSISSHFTFKDADTEEIIFEKDFLFSGNASKIGVLTSPPMIEGIVYSDQFVQISVSNLNIDDMGESTVDLLIRNISNEGIQFCGGSVFVNGKSVSGMIGKPMSPDFLVKIDSGESYETVLRMNRDGFAEQGITEIETIEAEASIFRASNALFYDLTFKIPFEENSSVTSKLAPEITKNANDYVVNTYFIHGRDRVSVLYELTNPNSVDVSLSGTISFKDKEGNVIGTQNDSLDYIGPNKYNFMIFDTTDTIDSVSLTLTPTEFKGQKAVFSCTDASNENELNFSITNLGTKTAKNTLFTVVFSKNGNISGYSRGLKGKRSIDVAANEVVEDTIVDMPYDKYFVYLSGVYD